MLKILIAEFHQESNSFNPVPSGREDWAWPGIIGGSSILEKERGSRSLLGGMIRALDEHGEVEIVPAYKMYSESAGPVRHELVEEFLEHTIAAIRANQPLDGACIYLHGATQSTEMEDVCGYVLEKLRGELGPEPVLSAAFDLHANITEKYYQNADYICGYQTYPHVDFFETGYRAAKMCLLGIESDVKPKMVINSVPVVAAASGYTTLRGSFGVLMDEYKKRLADGKILDFSIFQMQPWLDIKAAAGAVAVVISNDEEAAGRYATDIVKRVKDMRRELIPALTDVDKIIREAEKNTTGRPVILANAADSTNAGACGDSAYVLSRIVALQSDVKAAVLLIDRPALKQAFRTGVGGTGQFSLGGSKDPVSSPSVTVEARVRSLHDGEFVAEGPARAGTLVNLGRAAVISVRNTEILLVSSIAIPGDPQLYRHFGIEPLQYQMLEIKACTSFRAAYEPIASQIFRADTPGAAAPNLLRLPYRNIPGSFWPFSDIEEVEVRKPVVIKRS